MNYSNDEKQIIASALELFGAEPQEEQCIEECAELIVALRHRRRNKCNNEDVVTEIADVMIMCEQMRIIFGPDAVDGEIAYKLNRLSNRLNKLTEKKGGEE